MNDAETGVTMLDRQLHGTPVGPRVPKYIYVLNRRRVALAASVGALIIISMAYIVLVYDPFNDVEHVEGVITDKFDNRNSTIYRTAWFEINDKRWEAWDIIDDYEVQDYYEGDLEPWCDPLVVCDIAELACFGFILAVVVGVMGVIIQRDKIEVEDQENPIVEHEDRDAMECPGCKASGYDTCIRPRLEGGR